MIKAAQRLGFTLSEVADLVDLGRHRHRGQAGLQARVAAELEQIQTKIADLRVIAETLRLAIDTGCDDLTACAGNRTGTPTAAPAAGARAPPRPSRADRLRRRP